MTAQKSLKIAILEADVPVPKVFEAYGTYGDIFTRLLVTGGLDLSTTSITKYPVVEDVSAFPTLDETDNTNNPDLVLITGSKYNAYDDVDWINALTEFTAKCLALKIKVLGICFGHQIIGRAMKVKVGPNPKGWEISATKVKLTEAGKQIFPEFAESEALNIMEMHRDAVLEKPEGVEVLAYNDVCEFQGFYKKGAIWSLQGHPEFDKFIEEELIINRHKMGLYTDDFAAAGLARLQEETDGSEIAKAMVRFALE